jgi:hemolysin III
MDLHDLEIRLMEKQTALDDNPILAARSLRDEQINFATHFAAAILTLIAAVPLCLEAIRRSEWRATLGCATFLGTLFAVYVSSSMSHRVTQPVWQQRWRMLDQGFIYLLIVGSYTPFSLLFLGHGWWPVPLVLMWIVAITGFVSKIGFGFQVNRVSIALYLLLGWFPGITAIEAAKQMPLAPLVWVLIGGLFYTFGAIFLILEKRTPSFHAVWHLCVIAGSAAHYWAIYCCVSIR